MEVESDKEEDHVPKKLSGRRKKAAQAKKAKPGSFGENCRRHWCIVLHPHRKTAVISVKLH
jgi:hypothetical protein